jgi:hypothetical protein
MFILSNGEPDMDDAFITRLEDFSKKYHENDSRTRRLRLGQSVLRVGVMQFACWGRSSPDPATGSWGLAPDLLTLMAKLLDVEIQCKVLPLHTLVDEVSAGHVDVGAGYICRTPSRTTRTIFVPLDFPGELGLQAITRADLLPIDSASARTSFEQRRDWLVQQTKARKLQIIVVEGELAAEHRRSLFPELDLEPLRDREIESVIKDKDFGKRRDTVIVTDHLTCARHVKPAERRGDEHPMKHVFDRKIGSFVGGFLLPDSDPDFAEYFRQSYLGLMNSRIPEVGEIFARHATELLPFLSADRLAEGAARYEFSDGMGRGEPTLSHWLARRWPPEIGIPKAWELQLMRETKLRTALPQYERTRNEIHDE